VKHTKGSDPKLNEGMLLAYISKAHRGRAEGVAAEGLATGMGVKATPANLRKLRGLVEILRELGVPICAKPETGYYYGITREEIEETIGSLEKRGKTALRQARQMRERMLQQGEQKSLKPPGPSRREQRQRDLESEKWQDTPEGRMKIARWQVGQEKFGSTWPDGDGLEAERAAVRAERAGYGNFENEFGGESAVSEWSRIANEGA